MTKSASTDNPTILARMQARAHRGRGAVYKWLHRNHASVQKGFKETEACWDSVVESMIEDGVTGRSGARPNSKSVARVWVRVCEDIARAAELRAERRTPQNRSRPGSGWQPHVQAAIANIAPTHRTLPDLNRSEDRPAPRRPEAAPSAPTASSATGSSPLDDLPPEVKAKFDRLRQDFAETDRKRFGRY
jgi:hypothetical protein